MILEIIRGIVEAIGLARDLAKAGMDPVSEIRRIRVDVRTDAEAQLNRELSRKFGDGSDLYDAVDEELGE